MSRHSKQKRERGGARACAGAGRSREAREAREARESHASRAPSDPCGLASHAGASARAPRARVVRARATPARRGSALVEFALIAFAFYLLLSGTLELGRMMFVSHVLQGAARAGARELAITPLPATASFADALADATVRARVYDPAALVVDVSGLDAAEVQAALDALPLLNRLLAPLYVRDDASLAPRVLLRYPGALVESAGVLRVAIPRVLEHPAGGAEHVDWVEVVEEITPQPADPQAAPFSLTSTGPQQGLVALRIHYPFQAATMAAWQSSDGPGGPSNTVLTADDASVVDDGPPGTLVGVAGTGVYSGSYGLGSLEAMGEKVRPFRRLLTSQSVFRRELFSQ